jgi:hypothetical protein
MKSCFEFESSNRIAKKDTKITVHAKTYVKSNVGGALLFGGFFPELISAYLKSIYRTRATITRS